MKLNLGCGRDIRPGWANIDCVDGLGVDYVVDLDSKPRFFWLDDDSVSESQGSHLIEHLHNPLPFMEELWRVTVPDGLVVLRCPYGSSDDADEDPTHVRRMFLGSWGYFGQPNYWRADYGYRGDWQVTRVELIIPARLAECTHEQIMSAISLQRNIVDEMVATLRCVKPRRAPLAELRQRPELVIVRQQ